jgi:hypothetical protein
MTAPLVVLARVMVIGRLRQVRLVLAYLRRSTEMARSEAK